MKTLLHNDSQNAGTAATAKPWSAFRGWVYTLWQANCEEHSQYHEPDWTVQDYWQKYKYWLKQEYRKQL